MKILMWNLKFQRSHLFLCFLAMIIRFWLFWSEIPANKWNHNNFWNADLIEGRPLIFFNQHPLILLLHIKQWAQSAWLLLITWALRCQSGEKAAFYSTICFSQIGIKDINTKINTRLMIVFEKFFWSRQFTFARSKKKNRQYNFDRSPYSSRPKEK